MQASFGKWSKCCCSIGRFRWATWMWRGAKPPGTEWHQSKFPFGRVLHDFRTGKHHTESNRFFSSASFWQVNFWLHIWIRSLIHLKKFHFWAFYNIYYESIQKKRLVILYGIVLKRWCIVLHYWRIERIQHVYYGRQAYRNSPVRIVATIFLVQIENNRSLQSHQHF